MHDVCENKNKNSFTVVARLLLTITTMSPERTAPSLHFPSALRQGRYLTNYFFSCECIILLTFNQLPSCSPSSVKSDERAYAI